MSGFMLLRMLVEALLANLDKEVSEAGVLHLLALIQIQLVLVFGLVLFTN